MSLGPETTRVWRRWSVLVWVGALLLAVVGIWQGDQLTRRLAHPEHTGTLREIGRAIASDLDRAQGMGIPLEEVVGLEPWFAAQVKGSTVLSGLALTLPSGRLLAQHGLDPEALATVPRAGEPASPPHPWVTLAIESPGGGSPVGWLHVVGTRQGVPLSRAWGTLVLALALAALVSWGLHAWLQRHLTQPLQRIATHLDRLSRGTHGPVVSPTAGTHPVALLDQALAQQSAHLSQWHAALLQKLSEVRAAHFDPMVLARIDALASPLLDESGHTGPLAASGTPVSTWGALSLNRRVALVLLSGWVVALACAWVLLDLQGQAQRNTRATHETLRVQRALQTALALDQARAEPLVQAHTVQSLLQHGPGAVLPLLAPGAQLWAQTGGHTVTAVAAPEAVLALPERSVTDGLQPQAAPVQGIWAATDHSLQSGVARSLVLTDGTTATAVLAQPLAATLARMASDLNARWALADHRGQPLGPDVHHLVDRWRQAGRVPSWSDAGAPALLLAVPLNSHSGHTLGHLVVSLPPDEGAAPSFWGLQVLAVVAMLSGLAVAIGVVRHQLQPLGQAADQLSRLVETPGADTAAKGRSAVYLTGLQRDIAHLENRLDMLRALRRSRERQGRRQARFIRHQMMTLAERLDDTARRGVLEDLHRIEQASSPDAPGTVRVPGPETDPRFERLVDEVGVLALGFQNLVGRVGDQYQQLGLLVQELREALRVKTQFIAIQQELEIARKMQLSILPHNFGGQAGVALHGTMLPAREVGGDFYDFFRLDEHHLALVVADVSGKGVPAAFFMAVSRTLLRAVAQFSQGPADCLRRLNDLLAADNEEMMFVTLFYAVIDTRSGQVVYGNAGHNPPYVVRADGRIEPVPGTGNMALAVMEDLSFDERLLHLHPGDALFMYTDGVTEASDPAQALFGEQRLEAFLSGRHETPVQDLNRELVAAIKVFEAGGAQADDITCLMVRRDGVASHLPV